ncbi:hypothetical protein [Thioalkalivibrio sp. HK1]|uniref:hypothetical protein n=1 Tax=Thioalkalivibrio sp. HK1 TaxID=1469245 RepID=UPI0012DF9DC1|nr:hypothetical protein [Thioalkalivibrio sp. HK1]
MQNNAVRDAPSSAARILDAMAREIPAMLEPTAFGGDCTFENESPGIEPRAEGAIHFALSLLTILLTFSLQGKR